MFRPTVRTEVPPIRCVQGKKKKTKTAKIKGQRTFRSIKIEGEELEFSEGFTGLHTEVYKGIIDGKGFGLEDSRKAIEIVHEIRNSNPIGLKGEYHPLASKKTEKHPFFKS